MRADGEEGGAPLYICTCTSRTTIFDSGAEPYQHYALPYLSTLSIPHHNSPPSHQRLPPHPPTP